MFAVASIDQGRTERAMLVPKRAVIEDVNTNSFRVFVVDKDNKARVRVVQLAARQNQPESTKILTGIKEGERVATSNLADLYDGAVVTPAAARHRPPAPTENPNARKEPGGAPDSRGNVMQKLAEVCVRRPVFASMLIAAIVVIGGVSFTQLGVDRYPRIETPVVSVTTSNPGATPESIEKEITDRIEAAVNTVAGIDELRSTSTEGQSRVTITFDLSKNPDVAAQEVRAKVDPVIRNLPETADPPVVQKQDPDSMPIMMFSISAPLPAVELTSYLEQNVQKRLESVNGVGEVILFGARRRQVQVKIDPDRLNAYQLSDLGRGGGAARAEPRAARRPSRAGHARAVGPHGRPADASRGVRRRRRRHPRQHPDPHQGPRHRRGHRRRSALGLDR